MITLHEAIGIFLAFLGILTLVEITAVLLIRRRP